MQLRFAIAAICLWPITIGLAVAAAPEGDENRPSSESAPGGLLTTATRQNAFTIPFRIEPAKNPAEQPVEVQLHVSTNAGANWELASRVKPEKGAFVYRAPHDGEYWYTIRTVDKQGVARPQGTLEPQLKVTVDTVAPRLELSAVRGPAGEIVARWQAVDPHLKAGSFKLEYQADSADPWERVAVDPAPSSMRHTLTGEATWWPKSTAGSILVRAEISDLAGNPAVSQAVVKPGDVVPPGGLARSTAPDLSRPDLAPGDTTRWPADRSTTDPLPRSADADVRRGDPANRDSNWRPSTPKDPRDAGAQRLPAQGVSQTTPGGRAGSPLNFGLLPRGERPRMVAARSFELEYEIDSVGPSGIAKVELWATRDGGRTWTLFGVDTDNRSPLPVSVDGEGIFGFRVVVQSGSGIGGRPPAEGDQPDIWIGVDLTKPQGRITAAEVSADGSELTIRWDASDDVLDARPVTLAFAVAAQGPWTPIASGLENSGSYRWRLDERVPDRIFLRLEVRDEAGNLGTFDSPEPVTLDRRRPEGRIRGVRPVNSGDRN